MNKPIHPAVAEHVMEENERLRGLLEELHPYVRGCSSELWDRYHAALSKQSDPADTYTAVDMATAAAQGFRDGQAAVEPAPAQDEREAPEVVAVLYKSGDVLTAEECGIALEVCAKVETPLMTVAQHERIVASLTRPAQTEQRPDIKPGDPHAQIVTAGGKRSDQDYVVVRRSLLEAIEACEWQGEMAASSGNELRAVMAGRITYDLYAAPIAQTAPAQVTAAMWKAAHDSMESDGDLALALQEALNAAHGQTAPQPEQSGLVEALKRIQCLMADREAQALDGSQDRQLFVTILNIADAALSPSIPATYSCDYAGCSSKSHPGTSLCLAHHSPKNRAALAAQGASK